MLRKILLTGLSFAISLSTPVTLTQAKEIEFKTPVRKPLKLQRPSALITKGLYGPKIKTYRGPFKAHFFKTLDGDSLTARVYVWPSIALETEVRIRGVDAPEISAAKCLKERNNGVRAEWRVNTLLTTRNLTKKDFGAYPIELENVSFGKYAGRVIADVFVVTKKGVRKSVGQELLKMGLARPYYGSKRKGWCE